MHRRSYRTATCGRAVIVVGGLQVHAHSRNLSLGGVLVDWPGAGPRVPPVGTPVSIELEIGGSGWVRQRGHVQRCVTGALAIGFDDVSADTEDRIEDRMLAWLEAERSPRLLIVDPAPARRHVIATLLGQSGYCSIEAATPLEAVLQLQRPQLHIAAVAVAETASQTGRAELISYLTEAYPGLPVVQIGARALEAAAAVVQALAGASPP